MSRKSTINRNLLLTAAFVLITLFMAAACSRSGEKKAPETAGGAYTPPVEPIASSNVQDSLGQFKGKVVILDFWATWCGPCRMEIPGFVSLQNRYRDKGLEVVGVSLDPITGTRSAAPVGPFMKNYKINYTILTVNDIGATAGFDFSRGIPTTYLINRDGKIVKSYLGAQPDMVFENDIKQLL